MQKTANEIKSEFELLASGHYQIHSFLYAQEFEQQAYENLIYPLMLVYPLGGSLSGTSYTRNYRVVIADRVLKSEGNELEVESDTQLIALDTLAYWMKLGQNERFSITSSNTITPFWEKWGDEVTGHFVDIGIEEFYDFNSCAIPLSSAIPSPTNPCKDARILINSVIYGNAPSDSNFNVVVKNQSGTLVGSLIGGEWIVNTGAGCLDSTYTITNSSGTTLYTGTIPSGGSLTQAISNSTLNVNNSAGSLISSRSILAQGTSSYNVADSVAVIKDSAGTTLKSENILATASENITINDSVAVIKDSVGATLKSENILAEATENISISDSVAVLKDTAGTTLKSENILAQASENITINDSTAVIKDSIGTTLKTEPILAEATENITINDSTAVIKNSVGTTLKSENILAEATENITINDSSVENSDATYSVDVLAEGSLTLPDSQINVNSVDRGDVVSVKTIDVNLEDSLGAPVVPTSVGLVSNTLTIEVPTGGTPMNVDFSADKLTAAPLENITFTDLSDEIPTHWSWRFSDGTTSIVQNPVKSFVSTGFYNVILMAGRVGAGGVNIKNSYIEILATYFTNLFGIPKIGFSLRKLSPNLVYSGAAIRVRRSSDNIEQDINFVSSDANAGLDTTALLSFVGAGNGFVVTWYNQDGSGNHATQSTAANQPQIVSSGSILNVNGEPSILFDGSNDFLLLNSSVTTSIYSHFALLKKTSTGSIMLSLGGDTTNTIAPWNDGNLYENSAGTFNLTTYTANTVQNLFSVIKKGNTNSDFSAKQNNTTLPSFTGSPFTNITITRVGARTPTDFANGNIQEIVFYSTDQTTNLLGIQTNINDYYNVF